MNHSIYDSLSHDSATAAESLSVMMQKEQTIYKSCDYLHPPMQDDTMITESDRTKLVDWCYSIIDHCEFERETVAIAMEMVDRFLSKPMSITQYMLCDRNQFQLLVMAALFIAIKTNEQVAFCSSDFAAMSHGMYSVDEIEAMELIILEGLSWRICAPTSIQMARHILSIVLPNLNLEESTWVFILNEVQFQTESAVRDYYFAAQRPSAIAMAAIFNSLDEIDEQDRQALLRALLPVMNNEDFGSPQDLFTARSRLLDLIDGDGAADEDTIVSEVSRNGSEYRNDLELQKIDIPSPRVSPRAAVCCRRENTLCARCNRL
ncbi:hypothetical protein ACHAXR_009511 [Thalassiosira sp. AJA248-18]